LEKDNSSSNQLNTFPNWYKGKFMSVLGNKTPLIVAAENGDINSVRTITGSASIDEINAKDQYGWTALMYAADSGNLEIVKLLLQAGANVSEENNKEQQALTYAIISGHISVVEELLKAVVDVNTRSSDGSTHLMGAASRGRLEIVEMLLKWGANPNIKDIYGATAWSYAMEKSYKNIALLLEQHGAISGNK
jgi:uncharacterized protein